MSEVPHGEILPNWVSDGEPIEVVIRDAMEAAGQEVGAAIFVLDSAETWHHTSIAVQLDSSGSGSTAHQPGLAVGRHSAVYVHGIKHDGGFSPFRDIAVSIANSPDPKDNLEEVVAQYKDLRAQQIRLYERPIGDVDKTSVGRFRALALVEGLLITREIRIPGARVHPISAKASDSERLKLVNDVLTKAGWVTRVPDEKWIEHSERSSHFAVAIAPEVRAENFAEAGALALEHFQKLITLLAINRGAAGRIVTVILEQEPTGGTTNYRVFPPPHSYTGNLIGGPISGESDRDITTKFLGLHADPLVRLCCDLYAEALAEQSPDAAYLRLWSILEVLSGARVSPGAAVKLADGTRWPGKNASTNFAAPRVYSYLQTIATNSAVDENSLGRPAVDLSSAVRSWYARRNATGHYGKFIASAPEQMRQGWHGNALLTLTDEWAWLQGLKHAVEWVLNHELRSKAPVV